MDGNIKVSLYLNSQVKRFLDIMFSLIGLVVLLPIFVLLRPIIAHISPGPVIFKQKRTGKNGNTFVIYKFRTMVDNAEKLKSKYKKLNISDGPTFKIPNDPRYTKIGKFLAKSGLDELPQVVNVLKGEMSIVGPRPLPVYEAKKLTKKQKLRELVLPGIISSWVINGAHRLKFADWMKLDQDYVMNASLLTDLKIISSTMGIFIKIALRKFANTLKYNLHR